MTFEEANNLIKGEDPYFFSKEEREALESFGIKLTHYICEKCEHMLKPCNAINCIDGDSFAITTCNYFSTIRK